MPEPTGVPPTTSMPMAPSLTWINPQPSAPPSRYCNAVEIRVGAWELQFEFSQLTPVFTGQPPGEEVQLTKQVIERIVMSPQHAKAFQKILNENVSAYEKMFGEFPDVVAIAESQQKGSSS